LVSAYCTSVVNGTARVRASGRIWRRMAKADDHAQNG
jgi:hypothetical protein